MEKNIVKEFSFNKEKTKLGLYLFFALLLGVFSVLYFYTHYYFRAVFVSAGALSWFWLVFVQIKNIKAARVLTKSL